MEGWTSLKAFTPTPRPCSVCGCRILAVKKIADGTPIIACPRCDGLHRAFFPPLTQER